MTGVTVQQAARELGRDPATVRRWIAAGAPTVTPGRRGRGCGALVNVADLRAWRAAGGAEVNDWRRVVERELAAWYALPELEGETAWQVLGMSEKQAAGVVLSLALVILGAELPPSIRAIRARNFGAGGEPATTRATRKPR